MEDRTITSPFLQTNKRVPIFAGSLGFTLISSFTSLAGSSSLAAAISASFAFFASTSVGSIVSSSLRSFSRCSAFSVFSFTLFSSAIANLVLCTRTKSIAISLNLSI